MRSWDEIVLGVSVSVYCGVCLTLLTIIRLFIYSKPPGRRMVSTGLGIILEWEIGRVKHDLIKQAGAELGQAQV